MSQTSVYAQIDRIIAARDDALAALAEKDVSVPNGAMLDDIPALIRAIETGGETPCATGTMTFSSQTMFDSSNVNNLKLTSITHNLGRVPVGMAWVVVSVASASMSYGLALKASFGEQMSANRWGAAYWSVSVPFDQTSGGVEHRHQDQSYAKGIWTKAAANTKTIKLIFQSGYNVRQYMIVPAGTTIRWYVW